MTIFCRAVADLRLRAPLPLAPPDASRHGSAGGACGRRARESVTGKGHAETRRTIDHRFRRRRLRRPLCRAEAAGAPRARTRPIGRPSSRERACQYVYVTMVAVALN